MAQCDFIVATFAPDESRESLLPYLYWIGGVDEGSPKCVLYGARARRGANATVGEWDNGMLLVSASGGVAHEVALAIRTVAVERRSVARMDIQATIQVEGADEWVNSLKHNNRYQATRVQTLGGRGATLYVGAPSSSARLRVYNKTAESGIPAPNGGELLRVEVQTRDKYADAAYRALTSGAQDDFLLHWTRKMIASSEHVNRLAGLLASGAEITMKELLQDEQWVDRRKRWVERSVVPALRRLLAVEPEYLHVVLQLLQQPQDIVINAEHNQQ